MNSIYPLIDPDRDGQQAVDDFLDSLLDGYSLNPEPGRLEEQMSGSSLGILSAFGLDVRPLTDEEVGINQRVLILDYILTNSKYWHDGWQVPSVWVVELIILNRELRGFGVTQDEAQQELLAWIWNWPEARNHVLGL